MWFLIRLLVALAAFGVRCRGRLFPPELNYPPDLPKYSFSAYRSKGRITKIRLLIPCASRVAFRLSRERAVDRVWKRLGIAEESQSGDPDFDATVYIACDHRNMDRAVKHSAELRLLVLTLLDLGFDHITSDGHYLWVESASLGAHAPEHWEKLELLAREVARATSTGSLRFLDRYRFKVLAVEGAIWSLAAYAIGVSIDWSWYAYQDIHVFPLQVIICGLLASLVFGAGFFLLVQLYLHGSSRAHRVIVEAGILLLIATPVAAIGLISDLNRSLDRAPAYKILRTIEEKETITHRRRRSSQTEYRFKLRPASLPQGQDLPPYMSVSGRTYHSVQVGGQIAVDVKQGFFGFPWYESVNER